MTVVIDATSILTLWAIWVVIGLLILACIPTGPTYRGPSRRELRQREKEQQEREARWARQRQEAEARNARVAAESKRRREEREQAEREASRRTVQEYRETGQWKGDEYQAEAWNKLKETWDRRGLPS